MRLQAECLGFDSWCGQEISPFTTLCRLFSPPCRKWLEQEAVHLLPSGAKVKNVWSSTSVVSCLDGVILNTFWTGDADLRLYITTVQDG